MHVLSHYLLRSLLFTLNNAVVFLPIFTCGHDEEVFLDQVKIFSYITYLKMNGLFVNIILSFYTISSSETIILHFVTNNDKLSRFNFIQVSTYCISLSNQLIDKSVLMCQIYIYLRIQLKTDFNHCKFRISDC